MGLTQEIKSKRDTTRRWQTLGYVFAFWTGYFVLLVVAGMLAGMLPKHFQELLPSWQLIAYGPVTIVGALLLTSLFVRAEKKRWQDVGIALTRRSPIKFFLGFLIGLSLVALNVAIFSVIAGLRWIWEPQQSLATVAITLIACVAGSCGEELGFRGYPLRRLHQAFGLWTAQAIVAVAFSFYHLWIGWPWMNAFVGAGAGSVLFGMAAIASRGLAVPIGLHAAWNFGEWTIGAKGSPALWQAAADSPQASGAQAIAGYLVVLGVGILAFWLWHRRNPHQPPPVRLVT